MTKDERKQLLEAIDKLNDDDLKFLLGYAVAAAERAEGKSA